MVRQSQPHDLSSSGGVLVSPGTYELKVFVGHGKWPSASSEQQ
mgnify:CR=1 FL=1